jgi:hypothetical protein
MSDSVWNAINKNLPDRQDNVEDQLKTTEPSSMLSYGSSGQVLPGEIFLLIMETGRILTGDSVDGGTREYGRRYLSV